MTDSSFDLIVTLSPEAHHTALEFTRMLATRVVYWPTLDPTAVQGARETILEAYRGVREGLRKIDEEAIGDRDVFLRQAGEIVAQIEQLLE